MMRPRILKLGIIIIISFAASVALLGARGFAQHEPVPRRELPAAPGLFSPSNARTEDGELIPAEHFFPASRCASCHQDTHAQWSESLHRNAGREPFYKESVDILERTGGSELTQHCESCHSPVAVFSGSLLKGSTVPRLKEDEGVSCSVCHSITEARLDGTGSYTIRRPALLARADGTPVFGDVPDPEIMADIPGHRRAVMRPLLKTAEFCATCHKSSVPPGLNNYKFLKGFSAYDEWQQSGASRQTVTPFYRRDKQASCNDCHMPKVASADDRAAKNGLIVSHRWLGANTLTPLFYGQTEQVELTKKFLQAGVLNVDIFALRSEATGELIAPLSTEAENHIALRPDEEVTADVVVSNRGAAHSFPPELRDMYEPWVEFEVINAAGETVYHSGFIKPDGTLDESAHVYKSILLDGAGRPVTRHQMWLVKIKAYDNFIPPGRSDIARYRFRVPKDATTGAFTSLRLRARVNYRRFIQEYTDYVLRKHNARLSIPVVRMAEAEVTIIGRGDAATRRQKGGEAATASERLTPSATATPEARRWNDYGIGLLEQAQYGAASQAFRRASELNPRDPDPLISAAVCEMKTERFGPELEQLRKASNLLKAALKLNPKLARARFYYALVLRSEGKGKEAATELSQLAREYPRDREVQRQLGQTLYSLGRVVEARTAFETVSAIDPTDAGAYQFLSPIYASEGRHAEADRAQSLYLLWRDDPLADPVAARFFAANPEWADERVWSHTHVNGSPPRPTMTGRFAAPDK